MAQQEKWVTFDDEEEALSLSDLPMVIATAGKDDRESIDAGDDFEFRISISGGIHSCAADMCAADEVFFRGQFLPLRPSVSSDNGVFAASGGLSRCGSVSEPMDWHSGAVLGGLNTSRSNSSSSASSACVSRSHSSNSHSSRGRGVACDPPRRSLSNNFYSHPSPSPRVRMVRNVDARRRSTSSLPVGWGIFRLGVAKVPEIELYDLRSWRSNSGGGTTAKKSAADVDCAIRRAGRVKADIKASKYSAKSSAAGKSYESCGVEEATAGQKKKPVPRAARHVVSGFGFSCKCSPDDVVPSPAKAMISRKQKDREGEFAKGRKSGQEQQDI